MEYRVKYTIVGLFVILLTIAVLAGAYWLSEGRHTTSYADYLIYTDESVSGMDDQAPVQFNGVSIGYVSSVVINPANTQQVRLHVRLDKKIPITTATLASIKSQGFTGITFVSLRTTDHNAPALIKPATEKFPVIASEKSLYSQIGDVAAQLTKSLEKISKNFQEILSDKNIKAVEESLQNIKQISEVIAKNENEIDKSIKSATVLLDNAADASKKLPQLTQKISTAATDVSVMAQQFTAVAREARGTVHTVSEQLLPSVAQVLRRVDGISDNINVITRDLKQNPAILVRGKAPQPRGPGE